ncbi:hypothetical protein [Parasphingorhabdus sp.]|uniref:hypothetical protein n=1 Tax=Parasphingorhabdus sp. TaxID=2709688 RepID=UPI0032650D23
MMRVVQECAARETNLWMLLKLLLIVMTTAFLVSPARADSWSPPSTKVFQSQDGKSRVTVSPRDLESQLEYFKDKIKDQENPGLPANAKNSKASAIIEVLSDAGKWEMSWQVDLVNEIAPVSVYLSNDTKYLVTFDNWHSIGYGPSTIVYYERGAGLKRQYDLNEFLPDYYLKALPRSVSSRSWRKGDAVFDDTILRFDMLAPNMKTRNDRRQMGTVGFLIDLKNGHLSKASTTKWIEALVSALEVTKVQMENETLRIKRLVEPIVASSEMTERDWHYYLREAYYRKVDGGGSTATKYLRRREHKEYQKSVNWIEDEFADLAEYSGEDDWIYSDISIASSDQENLFQLLSAIAVKARPKDFRWGRVLIAIDEKYWSKLSASFSHTAVKLSFVDPSQPIDASPARLKKLFNRDPRKDDEFDFLSELN